VRSIVRSGEGGLARYTPGPGADMSELVCDLCSRAVERSAERCACGAKIDWLRSAPAALRAKLGRGVMGAAVVGTMTSACAACQAVIESDCAAIILRDAGPPDAALDAGPDMDAHVSPIPDAGWGGDCGLDAYRRADANDDVGSDAR